MVCARALVVPLLRLEDLSFQSDVSKSGASLAVDLCAYHACMHAA